MKIFHLVLLVFVSIAVTACQQPTKLGDPKYLPKDWLTLSINSWQYKKIPELNRNELIAMKARLAKEREGQYYNLFGRYRPETIEYIKHTKTVLDQAYLDLQYSSEAILADLTPELKTLSDTHSEYRAGISWVNNENRRMIWDDIRKVWIVDSPSSLSPLPTPE